MSTPLPVALLGISMPELLVVVLPIVGLIFAGTIAISGMYFAHQRKRLWHDTARLALEKGQPLPELGRVIDADHPPRREPCHNDLRSGLVLIAIGAGLFVFLQTLGNGKIGLVGAIPAFIGAALILHHLIASRASNPKTAPRP